VNAIHAGTAELRGDEARHLSRVLRAAPGQVYEISDNNSAHVAEIVEARPDRVVFRILEPIASPPPPVGITLCAALIKFDRFEWIVEKATELGVDRIVPVEAARSEKGLFEASRKRAERWVRIARESSEQSRRVSVPEIVPAVRLDGALAVAANYRYFLDEAEAPPIVACLPGRRQSSDRLAVLLGPEGGWTDAERQSAAAAGWQPVSLGKQILRAETAAVAVLATLTTLWP
jgi:16S rRNA (uracil1498-N3)-methyltransferase